MAGGARHPWAIDALDSPTLSEFLQKIELRLGQTYWVDSSTGSSGNDGKSMSAPKATLAQAVAAAAANDTVILMEGHAESLTSSGNIVDVSVAGLKILTAGAVRNRKATFTLGHASATFTVTGAGVYIHGVKIIADTADVAVGLTAGAAADGLTLRQCWFTSGALTKELKVGLSLAALCSDVEVDGCLFETIATDETGSETHAILCAGAADRLYVHDCEMYGNFGTAAIAATVAASVRIRLLRNFIHNIDTTNGLAISLHASTTGIVADNRLIGLKTNTVPLAAAGCSVFNNLTSAAVNESGLLKPDAETFA